MALSAIALCSIALLKLGAEPISSFDEGTVEAQVASQLFGPARDAALSSHPWSFATSQRELGRTAEDPKADLPYQFQLPAGFLRAISVGTQGRGRGLEYRIQGQKLHTNANSIVCTYIWRPAPSIWPPFFDAAMIARLAAEFCLPVMENTQRAELMAAVAEEEMRRARLADSQQTTAKGMENFALIDARY